MAKLKIAFAALAVAGLVAAAPVAKAGDDPVGTAVKGVGCAVVTVVTLPIAILGGNEPGCK